MDQKESRRSFMKKAGIAGMAITLNPLEILDNNPHELCASNIKILPSKKSFRLALWGDPQIAYGPEGYDFKNYGSGTPESRFRSIWNTVNERLSEGVELTNTLNPDFVISLGDNIHGYGEHEHYGLFTDIIKGKHKRFQNSQLDAPLLCIAGNHDHWRHNLRVNPESPYLGRYKPKQSKTEYGNYLAFLKEVNSPAFINYSFDMGDWHFILLSQAAGAVDGEFERHPEYLTWLRKDLLKNKSKPTVFCSHHPMLPQGSRHFDAYGPSATYRRIFHDILKEHGNVKYAFFGHVHNTVYSINKISWKYDGIHYITLPNISHTTRVNDFLEYPDFKENSHGVLMMDFEGQNTGKFIFKSLNGKSYNLNPDNLPLYNEKKYGYLKPEWSWEPHPEGIQNGRFDLPLEGSWYQSHYIDYFKENISDDAECPWFKREIRRMNPPGNKNYLYMYSRAWTNAAGAAHLIADVRQAVLPYKHPKLEMKYRVFADQLNHGAFCCPFIAISGYKNEKSYPEWILFYNIGANEGKLSDKKFSGTSMKAFYRQCRNRKEIYIDRQTGSWKKIKRDVATDFEQEFGKVWKENDSEVIILTLGNYSSPIKKDGIAAELGLGFTDITWSNL